LSGPADSSIAATAGVWKGSIVSTSTGQSSPVVALTGFDGHSVWMAADGRVWSVQVPSSGDHFDATFSGHTYDGQHFPDGTNHGTYSMMVDRHSTAATSGRFMGTGDAGSFIMNLSPMWGRPAALDTAAGVYTRSTSAGCDDDDDQRQWSTRQHSRAVSARTVRCRIGRNLYRLN
jgi:hypothetical protein